MPSIVAKSGAKSSKRTCWPELGLQSILAADDQPFMWEKLPLCPPCSRAPARVSRMPALIHHGQTSELKEICRKDHVFLSKGSNITSSSAIRCADPNFFALDAQGGQDAEVRHQVKMDARIWSALPDDIVEKVLARLPFTCVLRFRAVCQTWNSMLLSGSFLSSHSESSLHRHPCFLLCTIGQYACTFDPSLGKWLTLLKPTSPGASVIASTGSLFCLGNQVTECRVLSVCNPITRSLRCLPAMRKLHLIHKIAMCEDRRANAYMVIVAGEDGLPTPNPHSFNLITEVYNSSSNEWHAAKDPPPEAKFGSDPGAWVEGKFYCLTELPYGIVRFCAEEGVWEEVRVVMPPELAVPSLVTSRDRLLMVGRCRPNTQRKATKIRIWELVRSSAKDMASRGYTREDEDMSKGHNGGACNEYEWVEVVEVPSAISSEFLAPLVAYSPFVCAGMGSNIYITTHLSPKVLVMELCMHGANANAAHWRWLPQDPLFPKQRDFHLLGFSFDPRFDASP